MKRSYVELFFRHRLLLIAPVLIAFVLGAAFGLSRPREYVASATLWSDAAIGNDTTVGNVASTAPSAGQQSLLTQLLATRDFLVRVAEGSPLAAFVAAEDPQTVDYRLAAMAASVTVTTPGPQVVTISVREETPEMALGLTQSVVTQFFAAQTEVLTTRAQAEVDFEKVQLDDASRNLQDAQDALRDYLAAHPESAGNDADPGVAEVEARLAQAQQVYADAMQAVSGASAGLAHVLDDSVLRIIDEPDRVYPQSRKKAVLFGAAGGLVAGGTVSVLALLVLIARDTSARHETDLEEALNLTVVGTVPPLPGQRRWRPAARPQAARPQRRTS